MSNEFLTQGELDALIRGVPSGGGDQEPDRKWFDGLDVGMTEADAKSLLEGVAMVEVDDLTVADIEALCIDASKAAWRRLEPDNKDISPLAREAVLHYLSERIRELELAEAQAKATRDELIKVIRLVGYMNPDGLTSAGDA